MGVVLLEGGAVVDPAALLVGRAVEGSGSGVEDSLGSEAALVSALAMKRNECR